MTPETEDNATGPTLLLVDDHPVVREGLRSLLEERTSCRVIGEANNGREAVELCDRHKPDLVLMDLTMPEVNGIEATQTILDRHPSTRILILSINTDRQFVTSAFAAGAKAYLIKEEAFSEIARAIDCVREGKMFVSATISGQVLSEMQTPSEEKDPLAELSDRELEVLRLLADGHTSKEIGFKLDVSSKTVDSHRQHIMKKLGINSLPGLTKFAIRQGISAL